MAGEKIFDIGGQCVCVHCVHGGVCMGVYMRAQCVCMGCVCVHDVCAYARA